MPQLDFEANERERNSANLCEMALEIAQRSERLRTRILHFADQFGVPEADFWRDLDANPTGPLAATLAREARRQNIHELAAAEHIAAIPHIAEFRKLPASGLRAVYINSDGQFTTGEQLGGASRPSKSLDFQWQLGELRCYAAQKYTKAGGGNQDNQFIELEKLLQNYLKRTNNDVALFVLVDGPYYTPSRINHLKGLTRLQSPFSFVVGVNELPQTLEGLMPICE